MNLEIAFALQGADGKDEDVTPAAVGWRDGVPVDLFAASLDFLRVLADASGRCILEDRETRASGDTLGTGGAPEARTIAARASNDPVAEMFVAPSRPYERTVRLNVCFKDGKAKDDLEMRTPPLLLNLLEEMSRPEDDSGRPSWTALPNRAKISVARSFRRLASAVLQYDERRIPHPVLSVDEEESAFVISPTSIGFLENFLFATPEKQHGEGWVVGRLERFDDNTGLCLLRSFETEALLSFRLPRGLALIPQKDVGQELRIRGRVTWDADGRVIGIDEAVCVDRVEEDLHAMRFEESIQLPNNRKLVPVDVGLEVSLDRYSRQLVVVRNRATGVEGYGASRGEAAAMFADRLACLWSHATEGKKKSWQHLFKEES